MGFADPHLGQESPGQDGGGSHLDEPLPHQGFHKLGLQATKARTTVDRPHLFEIPLTHLCEGPFELLEGPVPLCLILELLGQMGRVSIEGFEPHRLYLRPGNFHGASFRRERVVGSPGVTPSYVGLEPTRSLSIHSPQFPLVRGICEWYSVSYSENGFQKQIPRSVGMGDLGTGDG